MVIRPMTNEDYTAVYQLWLRTPGMGMNDVDDSREGMSRYLRRNPETCLVAEAEGEVVGVILAGQDGRRGFLYHLAVDQRYRRQGIAARLARQAVETLRRDGISKVALLAFARNNVGNAFWESQGFPARDDVVYRERQLCAMNRIDT